MFLLCFFSIVFDFFAGKYLYYFTVLGTWWYQRYLKHVLLFVKLLKKQVNILTILQYSEIDDIDKILKLCYWIDDTDKILKLVLLCIITVKNISLSVSATIKVNKSFSKAFWYGCICSFEKTNDGCSKKNAATTKWGNEEKIYEKLLEFDFYLIFLYRTIRLPPVVNILRNCVLGQ